MARDKLYDPRCANRSPSARTEFWRATAPLAADIGDKENDVNTKALMVASTVVLGLAGVAASFAPAEILAGLGVPVMAPLPVIIQLLGASYLGFAMANWTAKDNMIGGIYARPLSIGNFMHFMVGALALLKSAVAGGSGTPVVIAAIAYAVFAVMFGSLVFVGGPAGKAA